MNLQFLQAALALALVCTIEGEAKPKSREFNRCRAAHEAIIKLLDLYVPEGFDEKQLNELWAVLDGPVTEILNKHIKEG